MIQEELKKELEKVLKSLKLSVEKINLEHPAEMEHGDFSTNIAMTAFAKVKSPLELASLIVEEWQKLGLPDFVQKIEVAPPGFINIFLKNDYLVNELSEAIKDDFGKSKVMAGKKIMVEYAHPNTHKEMHIGHMRTLITGEALARIFDATGASVFRANYQGDIGPHVAKSIWGTIKILEDRGLKIDEAEQWSLAEKAHLLGEGYVLGVQKYAEPEIAKEIDDLNTKLYRKDPPVMPIYERTRRWSLEYYDTFYTRFNTKFDRLFFESEVFELGKKLVEDNIDRVFQKSERAIIFDGEKYGLHKRVFVTADGNATYEGKDMALAPLQYKTFPFDLNVHVVANEQAGYFQVIIKALELLDPKFKGCEFHLSMGMVNMVGKKMSSRTGVIIRVDDLLEEVKTLIRGLIKEESLSKAEKEIVAEALTIAAVKYSVLRVGPKMDVTFDPQKSVSLDGDSGPYLEYTFARTQSVLKKSGRVEECKSGRHLGQWIRRSVSEGGDSSEVNLVAEVNKEEAAILRTIYRFPEVVAEAATQKSPNIICNFLFDLAQKYNTFYDKHRILAPQVRKVSPCEANSQKFRLTLTAAVGQIIKNGLNLLGIESLERM